MKEIMMHLEAFEIYYGLGKGRTYGKVASEVGKSIKTVEKWGVALNWQQRVSDRDKVNSRELEKITNETVIAEKIKYRKIIKAAISTYLQKLQKGEVAVDNVRDLVMLMKLDIELLGDVGVGDETEEENVQRVYVLGDDDDEEEDGDNEEED